MMTANFGLRKPKSTCADVYRFALIVNTAQNWQGLDYKNVKVMVSVEEKSNDTQEPVDDETRVVKDIGAGSQGHMFGYATDETPELMPLSHSLATRLGKRLTEVRKDGTVP
eukprot:Selendium_serpulae@DN4992_c0_g1_i5.p3